MKEIFETTKFDDITYIDENHSYWFGDERLVSVTQYLSKYKQPFDTDRWSKHSAKKEGVSQQTIIERWDAKGKISLEKGTIVHNAAEMIIKGQDIDITGLPNEVKAAKTFWDDLKRKYNATTLKTEWIVGDTKAKVAGRIDALIQLEYNGKLVTSLLDWKTGTIKLDNKYDKMKSPFNGLEDCSLNHYSIQLSLYRLIIERNLNIKLSHSILINLPESGSAKIIRSRDFRPTLEKMLFS